MNLVFDYLKHARSAQRMAHAMLLVGTSSEKFKLALLLARALACEQNTEYSFGCNLCFSCLSFDRGNAHYLRIVKSDEESTQNLIGIDELRSVNRENNLHALGPAQIFIFPTSSKITQNAANAFLKTLEEPNQNRYFFLLSPTVYSVLPTIASRCQKVFCPQASFIPPELSAKLAGYSEEITQDSHLNISVYADRKLSRQVADTTELPTTREECARYIETAIASLHQQLKTAYFESNSDHELLTSILEAALTAQRKIYAFANPTLVLEELLLIFPQLKISKLGV